MNDEKDDMINLREQLTNEQDANALLKNAIDEADRQLKQKEDENRELVESLIYITKTLGPLKVSQDEPESIAYHEALKAIQKAKNLSA